MRVPFRSCRLLSGALICLLPLAVRADEALERHFETEVRPLLMEKCAGCHGAQKESGGLRIDSRAALIQGGDSGAALIPGNASQSLLIAAVRGTGDVVMPPDENLSPPQIESLRQWIEAGAAWPNSEPNRNGQPNSSGHDPTGAEETAPVAATHWAFQPVRRPTIPTVANQAWIRTPVDSFVLAKLEQNELPAGIESNRRHLIRRVTYALTGLPPTPEQVDQFVADESPVAYQQLVERLLDSPSYGEQWARHWLDVARYSDTKGYVYAREERFWVHGWTYRDWVVRALNNDLPYDRFLLLQLAADQIDDRAEGDLAAMGFLTLGRRFLGVRRDIIDDQIDTVCRGTMGLTVACARCHDHKYDPIPTADYYSLYGVFDSCVERLVPLSQPSDDPAFEAELAKRKASLQERLVAARQESSDRARQRVADYLFAQSELHRYPADGFDQIFEKHDLLPAFVRQWERYLRQAKLSGDPVFFAWHQFAEISKDSFAARAADVVAELQAATNGQVHPLVQQAFVEVPPSFRDVCERYGQLLTNELSALLDAADSPSRVPADPIVRTETFFDSATCTELWKLQGEVDRWIIQSDRKSPHAVTLNDRAVVSEPRVFVRGNPIHLGRDVRRQFLSLLADENQTPFQFGSGRLELAQAIVDPRNPLTARVLVNRVWAHHFGQGLVDTPSDFGTRAAPPSHPELLDWLAAEFVASGWSLKHLQRLIVLSASFRQSSLGPADPALYRRAVQLDPSNRLLWRMIPRRLSFEELRDSMLAVTGQLDSAVGGQGQELFQSPYPLRRTVYGLVDRQYLPGTLRVFDFANPDLHTPQRSETTVPQQSLFLLNHPLVLERAARLVEISRCDQPAEQIARMFRVALQREPSQPEVDEAIAFLDSIAVDLSTPPAHIKGWQQLAQVILCGNEFLFVD